jgi:phosphosulfolactate phosphohydrolase-like enzyme
MLRAAERAAAVFAASLRNITGQVQFLIDSDLDVAVVPTGSGGLPREEDDLCAAYLAAALLDEGFAADSRSLEHVSRWARRPVSVCAEGASAAFLRRAGHVEDLEFVLSHVDDLAAAFPMTGSRIDCVPVP